MHQKRTEVIKKIPIPRKGTKYVARPLLNKKNSVPLVIAIRDMIGLAHTTAEVKKMIHKKLIKINGRNPRDHRASIQLFNLLKADKDYMLTIQASGKFKFEEIKDTDERPCKVTGKNSLKGGKNQVNFHDGSNIIHEGKIKISDTVYLDSLNKIKRHVSLSKGNDCIVIAGPFIGRRGKIEERTGSEVKVSINEDVHSLKERSVMAL